MCVIIKVEPRKTLPKQLLQNCYDNNPDGWGIMSAEDNRLFFIKDVKDFNSFYTSWKEFDTSKPRAIHFRRKTSGLLNKENCHPFFAGSNEPDKSAVGMMHNGMISYTEKYKDMNDTFHFVMERVAPFVDKYPNIINDPAFYELLEEVTSSSKLLFLTNKGDYHITNEKRWEKHHGCMFSNPGALQGRNSTKTYSSGSTTSAKSSTSSLYPSSGYGHSTSWWHHGRNYSHERGDHDVITGSSCAITPRKSEDKGTVLALVDNTLPLVMREAQDQKTGIGFSNNIDRWEKMVRDAQAVIAEELGNTEKERVQKQLDELLVIMGKDAIDPAASAVLEVEFEALSKKMEELKEQEVIKALPPPIAEGTFETVAEATVKHVQDNQPVGEIIEPNDEDDDQLMEIFYTPEQLRAMPEEELLEWADEYPFAAAQAILMFAGRT